MKTNPVEKKSIDESNMNYEVRQTTVKITTIKCNEGKSYDFTYEEKRNNNRGARLTSLKTSSSSPDGK